ncbi:His Kinase A (phospho-acceptor) domain-containing protein [Noviherbaspirillum humi]|uniref:histidine kinase n=1 Tax=Noviherbaspirillum humi TaxID=1688639 RepID=A0A239DNH9_9BURK|nr:DUF4118 domain-containing protein [Noviherbaspirillum humi]SNS34165.1 His Kinase A (phospho-acceptor) domain-containing protein [Noviherbaspirillum humi]
MSHFLLHWASYLAPEANSSGNRGVKPSLAYLGAAAIPLLCAVTATPLLAFLDLANIVMLFLLSVVVVAVFYGRGPAILATAVSVAAFDFGFVPPRFSLGVSDIQYLVTFAVMLAVGLLIAQLTSRLRAEVLAADKREAESTALYEFARDLSGALQTEQIVEVSSKVIRTTFRMRSFILLPDADGRLTLPPIPATHPAEIPLLTVLDLSIAQWSFDRAKPAGAGTALLSASEFAFYPLVSPLRTRGVLALRCEHHEQAALLGHANQVMTFAALIAIALERQHYLKVAQDTELQVESERLRNSLLAALSHDIRTPLTSIVGLSESLARSKPPLATHQQEVAYALRDSALHLNDMASTLLEMARLQSGKVSLNLQWQPFEEVVGSALRTCKTALANHKVRVDLPYNLPLVRFDAVLVERVLCNLLENAAKYTPAGSHVTITAEKWDNDLRVAVLDTGPGLPTGQKQDIFEKFVRGNRESALPGVGLGLAICRTIIEAHKGTIHAYNVPKSGACVVFTLPLENPPALPDIEASEDLGLGVAND